MVGGLETMYLEMLDGHSIVWSTHVSQSVELLLSSVPWLLKRLQGNKLSMLFYFAIQSNTQNVQDFFESLVNIVGSVRQAICLTCQSTDTNFKSGKVNQIESVPVELLKLVNFILEGTDIPEKGFSKELLALAQPMMFNFHFNRDGKRRLWKKETWSIKRISLSP